MRRNRVVKVTKGPEEGHSTRSAADPVERDEHCTVTAAIRAVRRRVRVVRPASSGRHRQTRPGERQSCIGRWHFAIKRQVPDSGPRSVTAASAQRRRQPRQRSHRTRRAQAAGRATASTGDDAPPVGAVAGGRRSKSAMQNVKGARP